VQLAAEVGPRRLVPLLLRVCREVEPLPPDEVGEDPAPGGTVGVVGHVHTAEALGILEGCRTGLSAWDASEGGRIGVPQVHQDLAVAGEVVIFNDADQCHEPQLFLRVNGVDVAPLVEAELNRRFPGRADRRTGDPDGLRAA